ncbi:MAG: peptidoglycan DD-metalloendopeptidase family protein [Alphaproteobacteria bacterium]|nr:peptidoglycan DD-metalloendopeptidase family protein [Alphaproteobacteria bacterium]
MSEFDVWNFARGLNGAVVKPLAICCSAALFAAGCSADVSRFGGPGFNLNGSDDKASLLPAESLTGGGGGARLSEQSPDISYGGNSTSRVSTAALPEATGDGYNATPGRAPTYEPSRPVSREPDSAAYNVRNNRREEPRRRTPSLERGEPITVERGDTLYGLSREYGVSVAELMSVNKLDDSLLRVGQRLYLPSGVSASSTRSASRIEPAQRPRSEPIAAVEPGDIPATWNGRYEVRRGDSLYKIARQYGVRYGELQRYNSITDPRRVMPGTVLRVPGGSNAPGEDRYAAQTPSRDTSTPSNRPSIINSGKRYAALTDGRKSDAEVAPRGVRTVTIAPPKIDKPVGSVGSVGKLRWPVRGKVIARFGARPDGTHNDGVNFAVPVGTDVHAAEDGVVAYAGSELRSYGNLILVRHDNGWVTAYAHNSKLLVQRGDKVTRGQVVAKSGNSGQVDQPQVHFELRQSSKKPVDPIPYLERL